MYASYLEYRSIYIFRKIIVTFHKQFYKKGGSPGVVLTSANDKQVIQYKFLLLQSTSSYKLVSYISATQLNFK